MIKEIILITIISRVSTIYLAKKFINNNIVSLKSLFNHCDFKLDQNIINEYTNRVSKNKIRELDNLDNDSFLAFIPIINVIYTIIIGLKTNHEIEKLVLKLQNEKYKFTNEEKEYYCKLSRRISYLLFAGHANIENMAYIKVFLRMFEEDIHLSSSLEDIKEKINNTHSIVKNNQKPIAVIDKPKEDLNTIKYNKATSSIMNTLEFENMTIDMELDYLFDRKSIHTNKSNKVLKKILKK